MQALWSDLVSFIYVHMYTVRCVTGRRLLADSNFVLTWPNYLCGLWNTVYDVAECGQTQRYHIHIPSTNTHTYYYYISCIHIHTRTHEAEWRWANALIIIIVCCKRRLASLSTNERVAFSSLARPIYLANYNCGAICHNQWVHQNGNEVYGINITNECRWTNASTISMYVCMYR